MGGGESVVQVFLSQKLANTTNLVALFFSESLWLNICQHRPPSPPDPVLCALTSSEMILMPCPRLRPALNISTEGFRWTPSVSYYCHKRNGKADCLGFPAPLPTPRPTQHLTTALGSKPALRVCRQEGSGRPKAGSDVPLLCWGPHWDSPGERRKVGPEVTGWLATTASCTQSARSCYHR